MMTREEAIRHLLHDWHINLGCDFAIKPGRLDGFLAAMDMAIDALRGPTREMVEKVWTGCEYCSGDCPPLDWQFGLDHILPNYKYCPMCGAPMTDEAVQMVMERWEKMF